MSVESMPEVEIPTLKTVLANGTIQGLSMIYAVTDLARPVSGDDIARLRAGHYNYGRNR